MTSITLTPALTFRLSIDPPIAVGSTPVGDRSFINVRGGTVTGSGIHASVLPGGGDFAIIGTDGFAKLDVRIHARTETGDTLYITYPGTLQLTPAVAKVLAGAKDAQSTQFGDGTFLISPIIETGSPKLAWLNRATLLGKGRVELTDQGAFVGMSPLPPTPSLAVRYYGTDSAPLQSTKCSRQSENDSSSVIYCALVIMLIQLVVCVPRATYSTVPGRDPRDHQRSWCPVP